MLPYLRKTRCPAQAESFSASHYRSVKGCSNAIKYIFICVPPPPVQLQCIFPVNIDLTVTFKVYDRECWCWTVMIFN